MGPDEEGRREEEGERQPGTTVVARNMKGGIERPPWCIGFREKRNSEPEADFDHAKVPNRALEGE